MVKIIWLNYLTYIVTDPHEKKYYHFKSLRGMCYKMKQLGISLEEVGRAVISMSINNHNYADFGIKGTFIFSEYQPQWDIESKLIA